MSGLNPINLPKNLYNRAKKLKIKEIHLNFRGGNDEGFLEVYIVEEKLKKNSEELLSTAKKNSALNQLEADIQEWAFDAYDYSGAGEGNEYGDDIMYDLVKMKASSSSWFTSRVEGTKENDINFEIEETMEKGETNDE
jgi:hypothetical protein